MDKAEHVPAVKFGHAKNAALQIVRYRTVRLAISILGCALVSFASNCRAQTFSTLPPTRLKATQEIAAFRLTGIEGYAEARFLSDATNNSEKPGSIAASPATSVAGKESRARQSNLVYDINLMTHSYIYHPSLLTLDLGGGPVIDKGSYDANGVATNSKRQMFNFSGRATILRDKPYTGALFYNRQNENQSIGPAQEVQAENTRYGLNFALRNPVTPIPLQVDLEHSENLGKGAERIIEDRIDQLRLKMTANLKHLGWSPFEAKSKFEYEGKRQDSLSGNISLPIQASNTSNDRMNLDTHMKFGANTEYNLANTIMLYSNRYTLSQGAPTETQDFNFGLDLLGQHSDELQTQGRYNLDTSKQGERTSTQNSASASLNYSWTPELTTSLGARGEIRKSTQLDSSAYGLDGSAQYRHTLPLGMATMGYRFTYNQREQEASALEDKVIGEQATLAGTSLNLLGKEQISVGSVIVSNLTRSQTFIEGRDYVLSPIGLKLRIQRVIGGNILDGEAVLIDYAYATGGSYALSQLDNSVNLSWTLKNYLNVFLRYLVSTPKINSGIPTAPLNPVRSTVYGSNVELPVSLLEQEFLLGGNVEREDWREVLMPYKRASFDAFTQVELPWVRSGNFMVKTRRLQIDYDFNPAQGVNLVGYEMRLGARVGKGINLSAEATRERDTGASLVRERSSTSIKAKWRKRKLSANFDLTRVRESQGRTEMTRTYGQFTLRRDF